MRISVIIPAYNRIAALAQTLATLGEQTHADFEVLVVDDGSAEEGLEWIEKGEHPFPFAMLRQQNLGAAAARNLGAARALGEVLLFLDADIVAAPALLAEHARSHAVHPRALVAGRREPYPPAQVSHFGRLIDLDTNVREGEQATFQEAFSTNLSIRVGDFQHLGGFDERFPPLTGFEDVDFAYRGIQSGLDIVYNPDALGYHNHAVDLEQACRRAYCYQIAAPLLFCKHPELRGQIAHLRDKEPVAWGRDPVGLVVRKAVRRFLAAPPVLAAMKEAVVFLERAWPSPRLLRFLYWKILGSYQLKGLREGLRRYGAEAARRDQREVEWSKT